MDQLRLVGEVVGSVNALMVLKHEISINQRQCCLLSDMMQLAFDTILEEIRHNLKLDEKNTKWKVLELPLKELHHVIKDAEGYIRDCMGIKDWWGKAISLHTNRDCVELHIHNLLSCFVVVAEAIESVAEISGTDEEEMLKKRVALLQKYDMECDDPKFFLWKFGKQFLVPREVCSRLETAWREDRWLMFEKIGEKKANALPKNEQKLAELVLRKLTDVENSRKVMHSSILVGATDYQVRRRLGSGYPNGPEHLREIHWLGESFASRTFIGDIAPLLPEISSVLSLSHPNLVNYLCAFYDEGRKEGSLVMELMSKDLGSFVKEHSGQGNRAPFSVPVVVDIMLQIARGMEYLHSKKIYHGELNPSNILLKARNSTTGGFQAKVTGFGIDAIKRCASRSPRTGPVDADIWLAPEVLAEMEQGKGRKGYSEKGDVYSFGMLCFELLTGKVPFEDEHLQGEQMVRNIRVGERPLFSNSSPKYLANLTKKCWQTNPTMRPSFSSICRILRYVKKILVINPNHNHLDSSPQLVDYCDMEAAYMKKLGAEESSIPTTVAHIPFQMVAYKIVEKEKINNKKWEMVTGRMVRPPPSIFDEDQLSAMDDLFLVPTDRRSVCSDIIDSRHSVVDVDLRTVISETMHRKLFNLDSSRTISPMRSSTDQNQSLPQFQDYSNSYADSKRLPEISEDSGKKPLFIKKLTNIKTKLPPESPTRAKKTSPTAATASPSRAYSKATSMLSPSAAASPSRAFKKTIESPKKETKKSLYGGTKSGISYSPAASPARELRQKNESSMYSSPSIMMNKGSNSPAASPLRGYNVCPSPIHPSTYSTYPSQMATPMNPNIRPSRLAGRQSSLPTNASPHLSF